MFVNRDKGKPLFLIFAEASQVWTRGLRVQGRGEESEWKSKDLGGGVLPAGWEETEERTE